MTVGLTRERNVIEALSAEGASAASPVVLLIGGLEGDDETSAVVRREFNNAPHGLRVIAIPLANPGKARLTFPPAGVAYKDNPESHYLWRWILTHPPDLLLVAGSNDFGLGALEGIQVRRVEPKPGILGAVKRPVAKSSARAEIEFRLARTPRRTAEELEQHYGHELNEAVYIPAMAVIGRLRLGHLEDVERIVAPYASDAKDSLAKATSSHFAGHLLFAELAARTRKPEYINLVRKAADFAFTEAGAMKEAMPLHNEMSDSVFMGCPILAAAGKLTGEQRYFDMAARHLRFMQKLCRRPDGIYRHSPLDEAAWGRGNGFPALGLALTLSAMPKDHAAFGEMLRAFRAHMAALANWQDENGMWREVVDFRGAYPEFSATAMIGTAMLRGIRNGWLEARTYQPRVDRAWRAIQARTGSDGVLVDVCESTGKQKSLQDYLNRAAILGRDRRGGGMALLFSTEMAGLQ